MSIRESGLSLPDFGVLSYSPVLFRYRGARGMVGGAYVFALPFVGYRGACGSGGGAALVGLCPTPRKGSALDPAGSNAPYTPRSLRSLIGAARFSFFLFCFTIAYMNKSHRPFVSRHCCISAARHARIACRSAH